MNHINGALLLLFILGFAFMAGLFTGIKSDPPVGLLTSSAVTCYADPDSLHSTGGQQLERQ